MTLPTLEELYAAHTGKISDKWSSYLKEYERVLRDRRELPVRLLEIGIQNGGSLEIWARYFPNAVKLIGCDINPACERLRYEDPRIAVVVGDANADQTHAQVLQHSPNFDIIIDDGSHRSGDIVRSFARYFPQLSPEGTFIAEDLHCSYWAEYEGGIYDPFSSISFFKRLADVLHHEHWGVPKARAEVLQGFFAKYGIAMDEDELGRVHSIEFANSVCIIRKAPEASNAVGTRVIAGCIEEVVPGIREILALHGSTPPEAANQLANPWSMRTVAPDEEYPLRMAELAAATEQISLQQQEIAALKTALEKAVHTSEVTQQTVAAAAASLVDLSNLVASREAQHARLSKRLNDSKICNEKLKKALAHSEQTRAGLLTSTSWRLTRPMRILRKKAKGLASAATPPGGYYRAARRARKVLRHKGLSGATQRLIELCTGRGKLTPITKRGKSGRLEGSAGDLPLDLSLRQAAPKEMVDYADWLERHDALTDETRAALVAGSEELGEKPLISVVMRTHNPEPRWLVQAVESVRAQIYNHWELCIDDDASSAVVRAILKHYARRDPRIKVNFRKKDEHPFPTAPNALALASGSFIALLDHDDVLREQALFRVAEALNVQPGLRLIYSDEDRVSPQGRRSDPYFKSDWNPELFLSHNMLSHLGVYDAALLREIGGLPVWLESSQDYELALRCIERLSPHEIHHIPRVLYSCRIHTDKAAKARAEDPFPRLAGQRALDEHFARSGIKARAEYADSGMYRVRYALPEVPPTVTLILVATTSASRTLRCIESLARTSYGEVEILLVDNGVDASAQSSPWKDLSTKVRVIRDDRPYNYAALNNAAVNGARGELVCLLGDVEVTSPEWLTEMVSVALQPGVGAVGPRLRYMDKVASAQKNAIREPQVTAAKVQPAQLPIATDFARTPALQSLPALPEGCLLVRKALYEEMGGLNEADFQTPYSILDFCLRVRRAGYRNVWVPYAEIRQLPSTSKINTAGQEAQVERELLWMKEQWGQSLLREPLAWSTFTFLHPDLVLALAPRVGVNVECP